MHLNYARGFSMKLVTKNFQLNSLANTYAAALYEYVRQQNGGDHFVVNADTNPVQVNIIDGVKGMRDLVDSYYLEALKVSYQGWEALGIATISKFMVDGTALTPRGIKVWASMVADIGEAIEGNA
ncbi:hypothetical protein ERHA54_35400 [Erwinia rhapontici]|nr:hypothetical protein ERHA54_35400 [Erwinia rhapontici]